mmetsp:Transcript_9670/g.13309  ORF Transcript_9670/g.13309 Transcript_9670/m.13309 type:complete len:91 (+) Transcript_9670:971-1243(+)|eukprot:CAMPEP_0170072630 /NCGR_PEP_ID=MMETSP0019_2-20121128/10234_1 /TAXON_ID=98059 /ORGANISM="Dinobryon sp., Strain UTEXLB2267" /LENGTH=90 /DNA_ID=CAMNT_0010281725 /DNA_START=1587 /DNA_END=1859 /DNA_ORIENTATION=-
MKILKPPSLGHASVMNIVKPCKCIYYDKSIEDIFHSILNLDFSIAHSSKDHGKIVIIGGKLVSKEQLELESGILLTPINDHSIKYGPTEL